jgi:hypothetical protein
MAQETCPFCGSEKLAKGVRVGQTAETGHIGLKYGSGMAFTGTEPLVADVCDVCGSVMRFWVKTPGRKWLFQK